MQVCINNIMLRSSRTSYCCLAPSMVGLLLECARSEIVWCETQIVGSSTTIENFCALLLLVRTTRVCICRYDQRHSSLHTNMNNKNTVLYVPLDKQRSFELSWNLPKLVVETEVVAQVMKLGFVNLAKEVKLGRIAKAASDESH